MLLLLDMNNDNHCINMKCGMQTGSVFEAYTVLTLRRKTHAWGPSHPLKFQAWINLRVNGFKAKIGIARMSLNATEISANKNTFCTFLADILVGIIPFELFYTYCNERRRLRFV